MPMVNLSKLFLPMKQIGNEPKMDAKIICGKYPSVTEYVTSPLYRGYSIFTRSGNGF
jgi:hypothetical protein